jgi:hypothetical protein
MILIYRNSSIDLPKPIKESFYTGLKGLGEMIFEDYETNRKKKDKIGFKLLRFIIEKLQNLEIKIKSNKRKQ